jgi:hypothetical protein
VKKVLLYLLQEIGSMLGQSRKGKMTDDNKDKKLLDKDISRRGFLGALGAVGAAAAIPLSWNIAEAQEEVGHTEGPALVDISEYIEPGSWEIQSGADADEEEWDPKTLEGTITGTLDDYTPTLQVSKYLEHPDWYWKSGGVALIGRYDLQNYEINMYADVVENTMFGDTERKFFTRGLKEAEIHCTVYGEEHLTELLKQMKRKLLVTIDLGPQSPIAFRFDAYATEVYHNIPDFIENEHSYRGPLVGEITFAPVGDVTRLNKRRET